MNLEAIIYFANVADNIGICLTVGAILLLIFSVIVGGVCFLEHKQIFPIFKKTLGLAIIFLLLAIFIPSSSTIYLMLGTQKIEQLGNTPEGVKVKQALDLGLDKVIKNLQDNNK